MIIIKYFYPVKMNENQWGGTVKTLISSPFMADIQNNIKIFTFLTNLLIFKN